LYWMGRYLERAENTTRLLLVTEEMVSEVIGLDEGAARAECSELRAIFPGIDSSDEVPRPTKAMAQAALYELSIDAAHPHSIFFALKKPRETAGRGRGPLTMGLLVSPNETSGELGGYPRRQIADLPSFRDAMAATQRGILSTAGAIEQTLARDPGWLFL